ncbi:LytR/AlgR family response regulator transcription factor [Aquimarina algicola]|uniref:Response regulator transcription factor n=1 Tax=Aquimarina algicola TaxID=2589995 RepID=A0A504J148_9FLAO|nr:LytTR family DNA-binding domain-containing protein [Aquimarina algicola]TPN82172.1 response regulator transcription factor [Aquimarina algicola]
MIRCVVIDDEPLARECINNYITEIEFLEQVGEGTNPVELSNILNQKKVDLIFLDIQMPKINGIDFLRDTPNLPMVILTTAYPSYALEGYDLDVLDYLLKPITLQRFIKSVNKANDFFQLQNASNKSMVENHSDDYFFIKCDQKFEKIYFDDILFVQALQNYVSIYTYNRKYISLIPLKNVEQKLKDKYFIRTHKSYIVSIPKIKSIENHEIIIDSSRIPISRHYRKEVKEKVLHEKLWRNDVKE